MIYNGKSRKGAYIPVICRYKNNILILLVFFCVALSAFAQLNVNSAEKKSGFFSANQLAFSVYAGIWHGQSNEIVYSNAKSDLYLSELIWNINVLPVIGFSFSMLPNEIVTKSGFFSSINMQTALPLVNGTMQDYDWDPKEQNYAGQLTNFSDHTNKIRSALLFELLAGWSFPVKKTLAIKPYMQISYQYFSFSGQDGYRSYKSSSWVNTNMYGEIITFTQTFVTLAGGVSLYCLINNIIAAEVFVQAGRGLFYNDEDNHERRALQFIDTAANGLELYGKLILHFFPRNKAGFDICGFYKDISGIRGSTIINDSNTGASSPSYLNVSGTALSFFGINMAVCIRL